MSQEKQLEKATQEACPMADQVYWNGIYQRIIYRYSTPHGLEHVKEELYKLEDKGEIIVHYIKPYNNPVEVQKLNGLPKKNTY